MLPLCKIRFWLLLSCEILGGWIAGLSRRIWMLLKQVHVGGLSIGNRGKLKYHGQARGAAQRDGQIARCWALRTGLATSYALNGQIWCVGLHTTPTNEQKSCLCEVTGNYVYLAGFLLPLVEVRRYLPIILTFQFRRSDVEPFPRWCGESGDVVLFC